MNEYLALLAGKYGETMTALRAKAYLLTSTDFTYMQRALFENCCKRSVQCLFLNALLAVHGQRPMALGASIQKGDAYLLKLEEGGEIEKWLHRGAQWRQMYLHCVTLESGKKVPSGGFLYYNMKGS